MYPDGTWSLRAVRQVDCRWFSDLKVALGLFADPRAPMVAVLVGKCKGQKQLDNLRRGQ